MIRDEIYYGNLLGLFKTGKWTVSVAEAAALIQMYQETERRLKPPLPVSVSEPVKAPEKKKKKTEPINGDK